MRESEEKNLPREEKERKREPPSFLTYANAVVLSVLQRRKRATPEGGRKSHKRSDTASFRRARGRRGNERRRTRGTAGIDAARWPRNTVGDDRKRRRGRLKRRERRWRDASRRRRRLTPPSWTTTGRGSESVDLDPDDLGKRHYRSDAPEETQRHLEKRSAHSLDDPKMRMSSIHQTERIPRM